MAGLQNCATELVLDIYLQLDNIDDALHLGRCSRRLNAIFNRHRFRILKSIIVSTSTSPTSSDYSQSYLPLRKRLLTIGSSTPTFTYTMSCSVISKMLFRTFLQNILAMTMIPHLPNCVQHRLISKNACIQPPLATGRFGILWLGGKASGHYSTCT